MRWLVLTAVGVLATVAPAAPVPKSAKKATDHTRIVGEWQQGAGANSFWIFRADGTAGVGDPANPSCKAVYKIDPTQTPKHLDWSQDDGKTWYLGVYELEGDELRISFGRGNGSERPPSVDRNNGYQFVGTTRRGSDK